jgi:histidinol-phosphatase
LSEAPSRAWLESALAVAQRAADAAEAVIGAHWRARGFAVETKADATPVTAADREAEAAVRAVLRDAFPRHAIFGEEGGRDGAGDFLWLVDPIDGTRAFVRGYPFFSTQIALMHAGELVLGVSAAGEFGERAWAVRGGGAFLRGREGSTVALEVSSCARFDAEAAVSTGNLRSLAADPPRWRAYAELVQRVGRIRGYGDFLHYHLLARGAIDLVLESDLNILDIAALVVIVREAGGVVTGLDGSPIGLGTTNALAANPALHARALALFAPGQAG